MNTERRTKTRYPLELNVRYQGLGTAGSVAGVGRTLNISSGGLLLACPNQVSEGTKLKVTIEWPSLLNGSTPLQLVTVGTVIRRSESGFAVALDRYQFRTMGRKAKPNMLEMPAAAGAGAAGLPAVAASGIATPYGQAQPQGLALVAAKS